MLTVRGVSCCLLLFMFACPVSCQLGSLDPDKLEPYIDILRACGVQFPSNKTDPFKCCYTEKPHLVRTCPACPAELKCCPTDYCYQLLEDTSRKELLLLLFLITPALGVLLFVAARFWPRRKKKLRDPLTPF